MPRPPTDTRRTTTSGRPRSRFLDGPAGRDGSGGGQRRHDGRRRISDAGSGSRAALINRPVPAGTDRQQPHTAALVSTVWAGTAKAETGDVIVTGLSMGNVDATMLHRC